MKTQISTDMENITQKNSGCRTFESVKGGQPLYYDRIW